MAVKTISEIFKFYEDLTTEFDIGSFSGKPFIISSGEFDLNGEFLDHSGEREIVQDGERKKIRVYFDGMRYYNWGEFIELKSVGAIQQVFSDCQELIDSKPAQEQKSTFRRLISKIDCIIANLWITETRSIMEIHLSGAKKGLINLFPYLMEDTIALNNNATGETSSPKIQWTGTLNILTSLFYELWKGQDKVKGTTSKSIIKAQKKDLIDLIKNNFLDKDGNIIPESTLSDYFNESKPQNRAKVGKRIELDF